MKLSLCIPTMDRWDFLKVNLPKYLENPYIDEIVICDENGNDVKRICEIFDNSKIRTFVNDRCLGAFFNKRKVVSLAKNPIICLMDSDNYAPLTYFHAFFKYLETNPWEDNIVYMPAKTIPQKNHSGFNYYHFAFLDITAKDAYRIVKEDQPFMNGGNFIVSKSLYEKAALLPEEERLGNECKALDVLLQNYLFFKRCPNTIMRVVPSMEYEHIVHSGSYYKLTEGTIDSQKIISLFSRL